MAYFNHAFKKTFFAGAVEAVAGASTSDLANGATPELGFYDAGAIVAATGSWSSLAITDAGSATGLLYLVQGSYHTQDLIGNNPGHGGYTETIKSKGINYKYITKIWRECCVDMTHAELIIESCGDCFPCGEDPMFRLDVKGSPALRYLNHNAYATVGTGGICCADGQTHYDPAQVFCLIKAELENDLIISPFIQIEDILETDDDWATDSTTDCDAAFKTVLTSDDCARMVINGAYVDTKFGDCSFSPNDHYNKEPVQLVGQFIDESGDPCREDCVTYNGIASYGVVAAGSMASTSGETIIREAIMTEAYMQSPFNTGNRDSARIREIELSDDVFAAIDRTTNRYDAYYLLHSVPRFNNPTGVFDNDQYLYTIYAPCTLPGTNAVSEAVENELLAIAATVVTLNPQGQAAEFIAGDVCNT